MHTYVRQKMVIALLAFTATGLVAGETSGIFYDTRTLPQVRERFAADPLFADLRHQMDTVNRDAERTFLRNDVRYNDQLYDIARVGNLAQQMALLYLYTGDRDAAALARECVETLMRFPKWDYFLEGGSVMVGLQRAPNSAIAVALVIETLGDRVDTDTRTAWLKTMAARGTEACYAATYGMRYPDRVKGWTMDTASTYFTHRPADRGLSLARWPIILDKINLKAIPASALTLSALTYRKYLGDTEDTRRWLEQAEYSVTTFRDIYAQDGSYSEGVSYAHYTTLHLIQAIDAMKRTGVADLTDLLNWTGYQTYLLEMTQPTRDDRSAIINFSDAGRGAYASVPFWIAHQTRDRTAQWFATALAEGRDMWSVLYYDPSVTPEPPAERPHLWHSSLDWIVARTGYAPQDLVVAMRSGQPMNHEHADRNSLIVKCFGEHLVVDPMRPPYNFKDPAWKMRLTAGHSALLIDGQGHQYVDGLEGTNASLARATIVRSMTTNHLMAWTSDATPAYQLVLPDVRSVTRTVIVLHEVPAVLIVDKVRKSTVPSTIQARFYGFNLDGKGTVAASKAGFDLKRPYARMAGLAAAEAGVAYSTGVPSIPPEKASSFPFVDVGTVRPGLDVCLVTVLLPAAIPGATGEAAVVRDGSTYTATLQVAGKTSVVRVFDTGTLPEFELE